MADEKLCNRPSCGKRRYPGKKWCSSECAALLAKGSSAKKPLTSSMSGAGSTTKVRGAELPQRSPARPSELAAIGNAGGLTRILEEQRQTVRALAAPERMHESATPITRSVPQIEPPSIDCETSDDSEIPSEESDSERNITPRERSDSSTSQDIATRETPRESSTEPLLTHEQASYARTSLVDDAIGRLHLQMKRLTFDPQAPVVHGKPVDMDDNAEIMRAKLACATATSMARLLKTKIDVARLFNQ